MHDKTFRRSDKNFRDFCIFYWKISIESELSRNAQNIILNFPGLGGGRVKASLFRGCRSACITVYCLLDTSFTLKYHYRKNHFVLFRILNSYYSIPNSQVKALGIIIKPRQLVIEFRHQYDPKLIKISKVDNFIFLIISQ